MAIRPWSLTPWSLPYVEGEVIEDSVDFLEYMDCVAGVTDEDYDAAEFRVRVEASLRGSAGAPDEACFEAAVRLNAILTVDVIEAAGFDAEIHAAQSDIEAVFGEAFESSAAFGGTAALSLDISDASAFAADLLGKAGAGVSQFEELDLTEIVSIIVNLQAISQTIVSIKGQLAPGEALTLDMADYTAVIAGRNALHLVDDWVQLDGVTVELFADSGFGGEISGTLAYRERWY